jgi:hypothetical protein
LAIRRHIGMAGDDVHPRDRNTGLLPSRSARGYAGVGQLAAANHHASRFAPTDLFAFMN